MGKIKFFIKYAVVTIIACGVIYNIYDNNRIKVVTQEVHIKNLPSVFDGFTILQITDLHEKSFGKNQKNIVKLINSIPYDMIAVTGDIKQDDSSNVEPFFQMIKGINNKDKIFFVKGNADPTVFRGDSTERTKFGKELENAGINILDKPFLIEKGESRLWVMEFFRNFYYKDDMKNIDEEIKGIRNQDIKLGLTHYPITDRYYKINKAMFPVKYDLVLAGHYHGGQYRIPYFGALYIPEPDGKGFLPKESDVSGLKEIGDMYQYVSRGLGASGPKYLAFRIFDTPEINVIKLRR